MGKEGLAICHEIKQAFIQDAIAAGALEKKPNRYISDAVWKREQDVGIVYAFGDGTLEETGKLFGIKTGERARQINKDFIIDLWEGSLEQVQGKYPLETIPFGKPWSQKLRERSSRARGGISLRIKELAEKGITDPREIAAAMKTSVSRISHSRSVLKAWNIDISRIIPFSIQLENLVGEEADDKKLQVILDSLSPDQIRGYLNRHHDGVFAFVSDVARAGEFITHPFETSKYFGPSIKAAEIPLRKVPSKVDKEEGGFYWVVFSKHKKRIIRAFNNDGKLKQFKKAKAS